MIRLILTAGLIGGLLQHVFGQEPARRKGNAKRARAKAAQGARPKRARARAATAR